MLDDAQRERIRRYLSLDDVAGRKASDVVVERQELAHIQNWNGDPDVIEVIGSLGFTVEERYVTAFGSSVSAGGGALQMLTLTVQYGAAIAGAVIGLNHLIKAVCELPENFKKLQALIRPLNPSTMAALDFVSVNEWLDARYGIKNWRYDPEAVVVLPVRPRGYVVTEETRGVRHLLVVDPATGQTEELPAEWAKKQIDAA